MNQFTLDMGVLDGAILAADQALAEADPEDSRLAIAVLVTRAVLPHILGQLEAVLADSRAQLDGARATNAVARDQIQAMAEESRSQTRRITRVFEEINPDAVADQCIGYFEGRGDVPDGRDRAFMRATVRHTVKVLSSAIAMSLSVNEKKFNDL